MGYDDEALKRPMIGIGNTWSELCPGHFHLRSLAESVRAGILQGGGTPVEFCTASQCATISLGTMGVRFDTPTRDITAWEVEATAEIHMLDGLVLLSSCDKIVPGHLLAAARLDIPTVIVTGGAMYMGRHKDREIFLGDYDEMVWGGFRTGKIGEEELRQCENLVCPGPGACPVLGTANTMQCLAEAVGLALPYSAIMPAVSADKQRSAKLSGMQIVELVREGLKPSKIMTKEALENMIRVYLAIGGSTNAVLHQLALAVELRLEGEIDLDFIDRLSRETPCVAAVRPNGPHSVIAMDEAGGIPAVMNAISDRLHLDALTVTGKTVGENIESAGTRNPEVIRRPDSPVNAEGGVYVLRGNFAESAVTRATGMQREFWKFSGTARVFDSQEEALEALWARKAIRDGDVIVVRYEGPRGGPGITEVQPVLGTVVGMGLRAAVVTDGKFSGFTRELGICQVTPEAALGGPIAVIEDGDIIEIDIEKRKIDVRLTKEELADRRKAWRPRPPRVRKGMLAIYAQLAEPASRGAMPKMMI
jgi:dihydroxy-acid dehydratase